jgi:hypothetical protein
MCTFPVKVKNAQNAGALAVLSLPTTSRAVRLQVSAATINDRDPVGYGLRIRRRADTSGAGVKSGARAARPDLSIRAGVNEMRITPRPNPVIPGSRTGIRARFPIS